MLYRFKTKNTGDVVMLEPNGRQLLEIMGKHPGKQGIILKGEMPAAIDAIRAAIAHDEEMERERHEEARRKAQAGEQVSIAAPPGVSLRHRAQPLLEMMQRCIQTGDDVVWGV
jgi:Domain of unknown function (DUF1840)